MIKPSRFVIVPMVRQMTLLAIFCVIIFTVAWAGLILSRESGRIASVWLVNAVAVTVLIRRDRAQWPYLIATMVVGNIAANLAIGDPLIHGIALSLFNAVEVMIVVTAMRRTFDRDVSLGELRPLLQFLITAGLVAPAVSAGAASTFLSSTTPAAFLPMFRTWFLADSLGLITLTPLLLTLAPALSGVARVSAAVRGLAQLRLEALAIPLLIIAVSGYVYTQSAPLQFLIFPVLFLAAFRMSSGGVAMSIVLVALVGISLTALGSGPLVASSLTPDQRMFALQGLIAVAVLVTLPTNAIIRERDRLMHSLIDARDEARAAMHAKSNFLATMSHEIRTPMTGVLGMIDLLRSEPAVAERERYFAALQQSANLLLAVVDDVLDFSKIESGRLDLESTAFDIAILAQSTVDLFGNAASLRGNLLVMRCDPGLDSVVCGDPVRVQQVMSNLVSNAIKFTSGGRVVIVLTSYPSDDGRVAWRFEVRDTGIGISDRDVDQLFRPFVQADASTTRKFGGTGLGLAISKRLVEAMDGQIGVSSCLEVGSTFWFEVAFQKGELEGRRAPPVRLVQHGSPWSLLVAEDNPVNQLLITAILRRMDHDVTVVANGRLAVEAAAERRFDAILMDMQMPEMDGLAATRAIRAGGGPCATVPIIALTADASPERRRFYDGAGLTDFLVKPIDQPLLAERLAQAIALKPDGGEETVPVGAPSAIFDDERLSELRSVIGPDRLANLLALLVIECRDRPLALRSEYMAGDLSALRAEAHSLKGAALSLGARRLSEAAIAVEKLSVLDEAEPLLVQVEAAAAATNGAASRLLRVDKKGASVA